jgi:radial spoke head protein 4A
MTTIEAATQYLKQELPDGGNVYNHLAETVLKVLNEQGSEAHELFEHFSNSVKEAQLKTDAKIEGAGEEGDGAADLASKQQNAWVQSTQGLFPKKLKEGEEPEDEGEPRETQDLPQEMKYFENAGLSIGKQETYILHKSIQKLGATTGANSLRFWGKICGTGGDYYIAEGELEDEGEIPEGIEDATGANKYKYWVCSYPGGAWELLENLHPGQVVAARKLKKFFTGKLKSPVTGYPPFSMITPTREIVSWQEKHLLRAQIARISSACVITPEGVFERGDDEEVPSITPAEPDEEKAKLYENASFLDDLSNWCHQQLEVNSLGRCLKEPEVLNDDGEPIVNPDAPEQKQSLLPVLEAGYCDNQGSLSNTWSIRKCNSITAIRNLNWPGAVSVGWAPVAGTPLLWRYANIYVGYGTKYAAKPYTPPPPPMLSIEYTPEAGTSDNGALCLEYSDAAILKDPHPLGEEEEADDE